jgi:hypothetical protein
MDVKNGTFVFMEIVRYKHRKKKMRQKLYNVLKYIVIDYNVNMSCGLQFDLVFCTKK